MIESGSIMNIKSINFPDAQGPGLLWVSRDGVVHPVDPRTFDEQPVSRDDGMHSDRRTLRAPVTGTVADVAALVDKLKNEAKAI